MSKNIFVQGVFEAFPPLDLRIETDEIGFYWIRWHSENNPKENKVLVSATEAFEFLKTFHNVYDILSRPYLEKIK